MMKRITALAFALLLVFSAALPALALGENGRIITYGSNEVFTPDEASQLESQLTAFVEQYGMELYFVFKSDDAAAGGASYAETIIYENSLGEYDDGGLIFVDDFDNNTIDCYPYGYCTDIFTDEAIAEIIGSFELFFDNSTNQYDYYNMYSNAVRDVTYFYASKRPDVNGNYAPNYHFDAPDSGGKFVVDYCDLFTDEQESALLTKIEALRAKYSNDFVLLTTNSLDGKSVVDYADDFYDYNGYAEDGLLFMVCMAGGEGNRDYYTSTKGYAMTALTDYARTSIVEPPVLNELSAGNYYSAFDTYLDKIDFVYTQAASGKPYDNSNPYMTFEDYMTAEALAAFIAAVIAFVVLRIMKSKMNTAVKKSEARDYVVPGSLNLTGSQDVFTHTSVTKTPIPKQTSSGSKGGSSHSSSSGSSHGGGGGKF